MIDCPTCKGTGQVAAPPTVDFLPGLEESLHAARTGESRECPLCIVIRHAVPGERRDALIEAAAGRISGRALHQSLRQIGVCIGRATVLKHRNEAHQP